MNIHGFMQLLRNRYFEVLLDHKAIKYMIKSKTESPMTRLKTLLLKLSPDQKDDIPLNFLQHFTPNYIEHSYFHLVENLYAHKTKTLDTTTVKRKCSRPPKPMPQIPSSKTRTTTASKNLTTWP